VLGRGLDAVRAVAEVRRVEVALEDPVLAVALLEGDGVAQLAQLAAVGVVGGGLALLVGVGLVSRVSLTSCWVIEEPPWETPPEAWLVSSARIVPLRSSAPCW